MGVALRLESIVATIDAAGGATTPELTIFAPGGEAVIANKAQRDEIPAGDDGLATWALRLADERAGTAAGGITWALAITDPGGGIGANQTIAGTSVAHLCTFSRLYTNAPSEFTAAAPPFTTIIGSELGAYLVSGEVVWQRGNYVRRLVPSIGLMGPNTTFISGESADT